MIRTAFCLLAAACLVVGFGGCPAQSGSATGSLRLLITDKPFPFDCIASATVTITEVRAHQTDAAEADNGNSAVAGATAAAGGDSNENASEGANGNSNANQNTGESDGGWITLYSGEKTFNLLDLRNGRTDLLADAEIPAGSYNQLRLVVTAGEVTLTDGRVFPLKVPSGEQSGIKLHFSFDIDGGEETQLLLDVDLSRAFSAIPSGHIDDVSTISSFKFHPSLGMRLINLLQAGSISGLVADESGAALEGASVTAYKVSGSAEEETSSAVTEADGTYQLIGLTTGTYRLEFSQDGFATFSLADVAVQAGAESAAANVTLSAAAQ